MTDNESYRITGRDYCMHRCRYEGCEEMACEHERVEWDGDQYVSVECEWYEKRPIELFCVQHWCAVVDPLLAMQPLLMGGAGWLADYPIEKAA